MLDVAASYGTPFDFIAFFEFIVDDIDDHSCLNCSCATKLSQIVCLIDVHTLVCQHTKCNCRLWKILRLGYIFEDFHILLHVSNVINSPSFYKLYTKAEM